MKARAGLLLTLFFSLAQANGAEDAKQASQELTEQLTGQLRSPDPAERAVAANRLGNLGAREAGSEVAKLLEDDDPQVRYFAVGALMVLGAVETAEAIVPSLEAPKKELRLLAADALLAFEHASAMPRIVELIAREPLETASILAQRVMLSGSVEAAPGLEALLGSPEKRRRILAVLALGNMEHRASESKIAPLLEDADSDVRGSAALALGLLDPAKHAPRVRELLRSEETRDAACQVLARIQDPEAWTAIWNSGDPKQGFLDLANSYTAPQACKKLRSTRFRIFELWRLELPRALEMAARKSGVPVEASSSVKAIVEKARFGPDLGLLGPHPDVLSVLSILNGRFLEGVEPSTRIAWIGEKAADAGTGEASPSPEKVRLVTVAEAEAFWKAFAARRQQTK